MAHATPVLVVDSDSVSACLSRAMLERGGFAVASVDASAGLRRWRRPKVAVIIVDLKSIEQGREDITRLRRLYPEAPILAFTALASRQHRSAIAAAGYDRYLSKPTGILGLAAVVAELAPKRARGAAGGRLAHPALQYLAWPRRSSP